MVDRRIAVIGAAGGMMRVAVERFGAHHPDCRLDLYDLDVDALAGVATSLPGERVTRAALDLFDRVEVGEAIAGAELVVLGAGPYLHTAEPVLRACIEHGVDYLDLDDDVESTRASLALDARAREAGVACYVGCGASPGSTNVLAADVAGQLDRLDTLDVCWCVGDERPQPYGAAVLRHTLHIGAGPCVQWRDGRLATVRSFGAAEVFPMGGRLGDYRLYEVAHPEPVTLSRTYPRARRIRVFGGLHPQPANGICRGVAQAVLDGRLTEQEAVDWLAAVLQDRSGSARVWRYAFAGVWGQLRRGECGAGTVLGYLWNTARGRHPPFTGGLLATATGLRDGSQVRVTRRSGLSGPTTVLGAGMAAATGMATAAFMTLALEEAPAPEEAGRRRGVLAPQDWVLPARYYDALTRLGVPRDQIVDQGYEITPQ